MTRRSLAFWLVAIAVSCSPTGDRAASHDSSATPPIRDARVARPDSSPITVVGPTIVVFFRDAYTAADSGDDNAEALGDLEYHLGSARPALDSLGVSVQERYGNHVDYVLNGTASRFAPAADSGRIAYLFLAPGSTAHVRYGVLTDLDLKSEARSLLNRTARIAPP
jgi:hypothetical protein